MEEQIDEIEIIDYSPELQPFMKALNVEWLEKYFEVEPIDEKVLSNPQEYIIDKGGKIYFAKLNGEIVGTVSLIKEDDDSFELSKMAVTDRIQSKGIGKKLMLHSLAEAKKLGAKEVFLLSNTGLEKAINLYKKMGFVEESFDSSHYKRADIFMRLKFL